jgi:hypothetical protein
MCAACGQTAHAPAAPRRFAALRNPDCRPYLFGAALAMMADNIEHVIYDKTCRCSDPGGLPSNRGP